jgi:hypothetical protein
MPSKENAYVVGKARLGAEEIFNLLERQREAAKAAKAAKQTENA